MKRGKKGISSLIATVLIIGLIIFFTVLVMNWGTSFFKSFKERSERISYESMTCSSEVMLNLRNACSIGNEIIVFVENAGTVKFEGLLVRLYGDMGGDAVSIGEGLEVLEISQRSAFFNADKVGVLENVEVFPLIMLGGKTVYCSNNYDKVEGVGECNKICENAHPDFCSGLDIVFGEGYQAMCCTEFELCC